MNEEIKLTSKALNLALKESPLVKEFVEIREIVFKKERVKNVVQNKNLDPKLNDYAKCAMQYEKLKLTGFKDIEFENMLSLYSEILEEVEEIKNQIVL